MHVQQPITLPVSLVDIAGAMRASGAYPWLLERRGAPSLLFEHPALTLAFTGRSVAVEAHTPGGGRLAAALDERFGTARPLIFPRDTGHDLEARLIAPGPFDLLRVFHAHADVPRVFGVLSFEHAGMFEDLPPPPPDLTGFPDALFVLPDRWLVLEPDGTASAHALDDAGLAQLIATIKAARPLPPPPPPPRVEATVDLDDAAFGRIVEACREHVAAGDVFQIVPSRTFAAPCADPFDAFRRLRAADPGPAMFYLGTAAWTLFGASPETAVNVAGDRTVEVRPIAGTRARGRDAAEDLVLEAELLADEKELAEHRMLIDLARNDVARVSERGTRRVTETLTVMRLARVMHLVSRVSGRLRSGLDALHALQACMNAGTLSGAPKLRATELLRTLELTRRGPYGGAIVALGDAGALDTTIVIRAAFVRDGIARVRAGAGVVHDSVAAAEAEETRRKAASVLAALGAVA